MDFREIIIQDDCNLEFLLKKIELIKFAFNVPDGECPTKFLLTLSTIIGDSKTRSNGNFDSCNYSIFPMYVSKIKSCQFCKNDLKIKKSLNVKYFDDVFGTRNIKVLTKYCNSCKLTVYPGFAENHKESQRYYDDDWQEYPIFLSTFCTALSLDFLKRFVSLKQKCHTTFHGRTNAYNYHHGYTGKNRERAMDHRRLIEAYFKFTFIEFKQRYKLPLTISGNIHQNLQQEYNTLYDAFFHKYSLHECEVSGCRTCVVVDGHMKAHRKVCRVKGCHNDPVIKSVHCKDHSYKATHSVDEENKQILAENEFHVEKITDKTFVQGKKEWLYKVKWKGFDKTTLEPKENLPRVLVELFEIYGDSTIPTDVVHHFEKGGIKYVHLKVQQDQDGIILPACAMEVDENAYILPNPDNVTCDTQKTKSRFHHRTGGILVMGKPCGILIHATEIFGAESISSVAEMIEKTLQDMSANVKIIVYDDACHLMRHVKKRSKIYPQLKTRDMKVDRFHFPNHVDPWCKQNMDPSKCELLKDVNTEIMEQTFAWTKGYASSLKYMKRATFNFMILDLIDRHNSEITQSKQDSQ